ncbi:MAG: HDOD domain-containing protein [Planctomycetota bacterium]|nr:HDOD domain-containing protein [Planctomycetota bacterium]
MQVPPLKDSSAARIRIPSLPQVVTRVTELMSRDTVELEDLTAIVEEDPPLATRVLQIANSVAFGQRSQILDIRRAAIVIGAQELQNIVMQVAIIRNFEHIQQRGYDLESLWRHSILTARVCRELANNIQDPRVRITLAPGDFFTLGLLHDLGKVVLLDNFGERYMDVVEDAKQKEHVLEQSEQEILGFDHAAVGGRVTADWGLPQPLVQAIEQHHKPFGELEELPEIYVLACADVLANVVQFGAAAARRPIPPRELMEAAGLGREQLVLVRDRARQLVADIVI